MACALLLLPDAAICLVESLLCFVGSVEEEAVANCIYRQCLKKTKFSWVTAEKYLESGATYMEKIHCPHCKTKGEATPVQLQKKHYTLGCIPISSKTDTGLKALQCKSCQKTVHEECLYLRKGAKFLDEWEKNGMELAVLHTVVVIAAGKAGLANKQIPHVVAVVDYAIGVKVTDAQVKKAALYLVQAASSKCLTEGLKAFHHEDHPISDEHKEIIARAAAHATLVNGRPHPKKIKKLHKVAEMHGLEKAHVERIHTEVREKHGRGCCI